MEIGQSFSPIQQPQLGQNPQRPQGQQNVQDAIKILSFQLPKVVGQNSPAPQQIMQGPSAQGDDLGNALAMEWLKRLFSGQVNQSGPPSSPNMSTQPLPPTMGTPPSPFAPPIMSTQPMPRMPDPTTLNPNVTFNTPPPTDSMVTPSQDQSPIAGVRGGPR